MTKRTRRPNVIDELMNEHIEMPGCPQLIVTRAQAYRFLTEITEPGPWSPTENSVPVVRQHTSNLFRTADYMVFNSRRVAVDEPLSAPEFRDRVFAAMRADG